MLPIIALAIVAGCTIKGRVELRIDGKKPIPSSTKLKLKLEGKEKTKITYQSPVTHNRVVVNEENVIKKSEQKVTLHDGGSDDLLPGKTYKFPFVMKIPKKLPSTTAIEQPKDWISSTIGIRDRVGSFSIEYWLVVKSETTIDSDKDGRRKPVDKHKYIISKRPLSIAARELSTEKMKPEMVEPTYMPLEVTTLGGLRKKNYGSIAIAARIPNSSAGRGSSMDAYLTLQNCSKAEIVQVEILLFERVQWRAEHLNKYMESKFVLLENAIAKGGMNKRKIIRDPPTTVEAAVDGNSDYDEHTTVQDPVLRKSMVDEIYNDENRLVLEIPQAVCRDTYIKGELILIEHFLRIKIHTSKSNVSNCSVEIPVTLGFAPLPDVVATEVFVGTTGSSDNDSTDIDGNASIIRELPLAEAIEYHFENLM